jgi:putative chitinase
MLPTESQLQAAVGCRPEIARAIIGPMQETFTLYDITTGARIAAFLAQAGHESAGFTRTKESLNYSADGLIKTWPSRFTRAQAELVARKPEHIANIVYGKRLGNKNPGDGFRYLGRGWIMVTGLANYESITELLTQKLTTVPDFTMHPELLESPRWAALSAGAYWDDHELNDLADSGEFEKMTRKINGGLIGYADRKARYAKALRVFSS